MSTVEFVCLANSRKLGGRCLAGVDLANGSWIRPVSGVSAGELHTPQYTLDSGKPAGLLDVIAMDLSIHVPEAHQPENWVIAAAGWRYIRTLDRAEALQLLSSVQVSGPALLGNEADRVPVAGFAASPATTSLAIVRPSNFTFVVGASITARRQIRARFDLAGRQYSLGVTDPVWEEALSKVPMGDVAHADAGIRETDAVFLTVSLGEPFHGDCYKLVAAVMAP